MVYGFNLLLSTLLVVGPIQAAAPESNREPWREPTPTESEKKLENARAGIVLGALALSFGAVAAGICGSAAASGYSPSPAWQEPGLAIGFASGIVVGVTGLALVTGFGTRARRLRRESWSTSRPPERWTAEDAYLKRTAWAGAGLASGGASLMTFGTLVVGGEFEWIVPLGIGSAITATGLALTIGAGSALARHRHRRGSTTSRLHPSPAGLTIRF